MGTIYRNDNGDGTFSPWSFFSEKSGKILEFESEDAAKTALEAEGPAQSISSALGGNDDVEESDAQTSEDDGTDNNPSGEPAEPEDSESLAPTARKRGRPRKSAAPEPTSVLSAAFVKKIKERLASGTATISVELERYLIGRFGFSTEEIDEDDPDVEILKMGWAALWESYLAGKEPPWWLLVAFGHCCITVRLIASAKRKEKATANVS
jgi:hypothetical protein